MLEEVILLIQLRERKSCFILVQFLHDCEVVLSEPGPVFQSEVRKFNEVHERRRSKVRFEGVDPPCFFLDEWLNCFRFPDKILSELKPGFQKFLALIALHARTILTDLDVCGARSSVSEELGLASFSLLDSKQCQGILLEASSLGPDCRSAPSSKYYL